MKTLIILFSVLISGCSLLPKINSQVIKVQTPVLYSPAPPVIVRPDLVIHDLPLTALNDPGEVARAYKISVIQLLGYIESMEKVLDNYQLISETLDTTGIIIDDGIEVIIE